MKLLIKLFTVFFVFITVPLYANNLATINITYIIEKNIDEKKSKNKFIKFDLKKVSFYRFLDLQKILWC